MSTTQLRVKKRNGNLEQIDMNKIHRVVTWAAEGLANVSVSQVELKSHIQFFDGITTKEIHEALIKSARELISATTPQYQYLAARLLAFQVRKEAYGVFETPTLLDQITRMVELGKYDKELLEKYTTEEIALLDSAIIHKRDLDFAYAGMEQLASKYLVQDRTTGEIYESPQFVYMLIGMCLFQDYPKHERLFWIKEFYDVTSDQLVSLPTPIMGGVRTPTRQFSSCVLIEMEDSLKGIQAANCAIMDYISQRAGIGVNFGRLRAENSRIRGGEAKHTGVIPFLKTTEATVKCCSQGGIRGGAATAFFPWWHLDAESFVVLKNNRGTEDNRVRKIDYGIQLNKAFYRMASKGGKMALLCPNENKELYENFFSNQAEFERLYEEAIADDSKRKKWVDARDYLNLIVGERAQTGRIYIQNVDHCNNHMPFDPVLAPVRQSNLCLEIALPTKPLQYPDDPEGEIALCTLAAFNLLKVKTHEQFERCSRIVVRALDALLDYQDYRVEAARNSTMQFRNLGVGVVNFAARLASEGFKYGESGAHKLTHEMFESMQFYLMSASNELAQEYGACEGMARTRLRDGWLPIDTYNKNVDDIGNYELQHDWEHLREKIKTYGQRNATVSALMPSETSSQVLNATNGIEPPRELVSVKASKDGSFKQVVPGIEEYGINYTMAWKMDNVDYLETCALMQKFVDQTISANTNYVPEDYPNEMVPVKKIIQDLITAWKYGVKTLYYHNTKPKGKDQLEIKPEEECGGGGCKI
jgi:ribonucleoside-diphosphate reductase alpha chain